MDPSNEENMIITFGNKMDAEKVGRMTSSWPGVWECEAGSVEVRLGVWECEDGSVGVWEGEAGRVRVRLKVCCGV